MKWSDTGGGDFEQPPVGTHIARCVKVIDIGTQKGEWKGNAIFRRQCIIGWELPLALISEGDWAGKPFAVSRFYTASLSEKANLRKDLENWRGKSFTAEELNGFDSKNILGKPCLLSLTENDKKKVRVTGIMAVPKGTQVPDQVNPPVFFSLEKADFNQETFDALSEGYKKLIMVSPEYQDLKNPANHNLKGKFDDLEDDIPF